MKKRNGHGPITFEFLLIVLLVLPLSGCLISPPKVSRWNAPDTLSVERVFNAAVQAVADNRFTIVSSDRSAGVISARKQESAGDKMAERRMNIRVRQDGTRVVVTTQVSGSDVGVIEGALGGAVNKEITHNFYVSLFRELDVRNPAERAIVVEDAR